MISPLKAHKILNKSESPCKTLKKSESNIALNPLITLNEEFKKATPFPYLMDKVEASTKSSVDTVLFQSRKQSLCF